MAMANDDFEVMPRGSMEEMRVLRQFANELIQLNREGRVEGAASLQISALEIWYHQHNEKYPI